MLAMRQERDYSARVWQRKEWLIRTESEPERYKNNEESKQVIDKARRGHVI